MKKHGTSMRTQHPRLAPTCLTALVFLATLAAAGDRTGTNEAAGSESKAKGATMKVTATVRSPTMIAVRFHHDMCPYCKKLEPRFSKLVHENDMEFVLFLTLDLTNKSTQQQAALMLGALGLEHVWTGDLSKIGTVLFVDGETKMTISKYRSTESVGPLHVALRAAIDSQKNEP